MYVYNLRKKLDSYYLHQGKNDKVLVSIPKGHYLLEFAPNPAHRQKYIPKRYIVLNALFVLIVLAINFIYWNQHFRKERKILRPLENSIMWGDILKSDLPVLVVLGDYFLYQDTVSQYNYFVRNPRINSIEEFEAFVYSDPLENSVFRPTSLTFLGKFSVWCFNDIIHHLVGANIPIDLRLSSNLQWQDFQKYNIIFVGSFKTHRILKNYLANLNFSYQVYPNTLFYHDPETDSTFAYHGPRRIETGFTRDFALVVKVPGPVNNSIVVISSTHDIGHMSVVESLTNEEFLSRFEKEHLTKDNPYFLAVFEVQGFERTGFFPKLLHINSISPDYTFQMP